MWRVSQEALAGFEVQSGLDVKMFRERVGPKFAFNLESYEVAFHVSVDLEISGGKARFENANGFSHFLLQAFHIGRSQAAELAHAEIENRSVSFGVLLELKGLHPFDAKVSLGIEQPFKIAQDAAPILLMRNDSLGPAFLGFVGLVISKPIQEARLETLDGSWIRHGLILWCDSPGGGDPRHPW
jgi:hypothetical protein